jgi:hypothetical protein
VVERIASLPNEEHVDLILVAGDVFDAQMVSDRTIPFPGSSMRPEPLRVLRGMFGDGGADVLGGLLAADTGALHQVLCGQPAFPLGGCLDQAAAKGKIPEGGFRGVAAFHGVLTCLKS